MTARIPDDQVSVLAGQTFRDDILLDVRPAPMPAVPAPGSGIPGCLLRVVRAAIAPEPPRMAEHREVPMRLRLDRGRPYFSRYTRRLRLRRELHDDRD